VSSRLDFTDGQISDQGIRIRPDFCYPVKYVSSWTSCIKSDRRV